MADTTDNNDKSKDVDIPIPTALPSSAGTEPSTSANSSWKIPYGMEDHIESGTLYYITLRCVALHWSTSLCGGCLLV
jgi:hypothetical protein